MSYCLRRHLRTLICRVESNVIHDRIRFRSMSSNNSTPVPSADADGDHPFCGHTKPTHIPVMADEVFHLLEPKPGHTLIDMTFGAGGHSQFILHHVPGVQLIASDRDPLAFRMAQDLSQHYEGGPSRVIPLLGRFSELPDYLAAHDIQKGTVDSFLFDLGASSMQFDTPKRGFSLSKDGPLDMRMDGGRFPDSPTAADVINNLDASELHTVFRNYGEERLSRSIAQAIVDARYAFGNITRTKQLATVVDMAFEGNHRQDKLQRRAHPATKIFQALRIFVNNELNELHNGLELAWHYLRPGGRCVVIAFHSLEDRIVKRHFHGIEMDAQANMSLGDHHRNSLVIQPMEYMKEILSKRWQPLSKKVITPSMEEISANPRSRSAKLRAAIKKA